MLTSEQLNKPAYSIPVQQELWGTGKQSVLDVVSSTLCMMITESKLPNDYIRAYLFDHENNDQMDLAEA